MKSSEIKVYYVDCIHDSRVALLLGPFGTLAAAQLEVDTARGAAIAIDPWLHFAKFGTCGITCTNADILPQGKLNSLV